MLLAVDIGNSSTKFGVYDGEQLVSKYSTATTDRLSPEDLEAVVANVPITGAIICSVVPAALASLVDSLKQRFVIEPVVVENDFDFGLTIRHEPLDTAGTDRIVNAFSAAAKYGVPCIVCSFGTALTIDAISKDRELLGGIIAPGMRAMAGGLHTSTAQLPDVEIDVPERLLGNTTVDAITSGVFYGQVGIAEGIVQRIKHEIGDNPKVVATGGFASMIAGHTTHIDIVDEALLLDGLQMLHSRSCRDQGQVNPPSGFA
jgi:type III pantothenate kinase